MNRVAPAPEVGSAASGAATATPARNGPIGAAAPTGAGAPAGAAALDQVNIRPLDVPGALQILIAEVRAALTAIVVDATDGAAPRNLSVDHTQAFIDGPAPAARVLVDLLLRSLPEPFAPGPWSEALPRAEAALQQGVQSALAAISAWRDLAPAVLQAAQGSASLASSLIAEEFPYPSWPPPEWAAMAPRLALFWRRRRALRRRWVDPDHETAPWDDRGESAT